MKILYVGVCDDEEFFLKKQIEYIKVLETEVERKIICKEYLQVSDLMSDVSEKKVQCDLVFLDIEMQPIGGIDAAAYMRKHGYTGEICFVTSHEEYALNAYDLDAIGYLVKPVTYEALKKVITKALVQISYREDEREAAKKYLEINVNKGNCILDVNQIIYIEKRKNQCVIHMENGEKICYEPLKQIFQRLNTNIFGYVHQGFIVNFNKVKEVGNKTVFFGDDVEVPLSRKHKKEVKERHADHIRRARGNL